LKRILIILGILCIILFVLILYQKSDITNEEGIKIFYKNQEFYLSYSEIRLHKQVSFTTNRDDVFSGYNIFNILSSIDISTSSNSNFTLQSRDGGSLKLTKEENETFYLVFQEDTTGQFIRLVIPTDEFSQRWIKYIVTIEIE